MISTVPIGANASGLVTPTFTAYGVPIVEGDGDTVTIVTSLKVKGSLSIKAGTKVRDIRLVAPVNGHDIDCKIDGFGAMQLKSSVVKKI